MIEIVSALIGNHYSHAGQVESVPSLLISTIGRSDPKVSNIWPRLRHPSHVECQLQFYAFKFQYRTSIQLTRNFNLRQHLFRDTWPTQQKLHVVVPSPHSRYCNHGASSSVIRLAQSEICCYSVSENTATVCSIAKHCQRPATNTVVEAEFNWMRVPGVSFHSGRIDIKTPDLNSDKAMVSFLEDLRTTIQDAVKRVCHCLPTYLVSRYTEQDTYLVSQLTTTTIKQWV